MITFNIRINNPDVLYRRSVAIAYQANIVAAIGGVFVSCVIEIQAANGVAVAVECALISINRSSNRCPTMHCCAVEIAISRYV